MTKYEVNVTATAVVSQIVELDATNEKEAIEMAEELSMCYYGDFEVDGDEDITITDIEIESEWEEE
jgi:hypothetical protein